jgi:hypothetical protein
MLPKKVKIKQQKTGLIKICDLENGFLIFTFLGALYH